MHVCVMSLFGVFPMHIRVFFSDGALRYYLYRDSALIGAFSVMSDEDLAVVFEQRLAAFEGLVAPVRTRTTKKRQ